MKLVIIENNKMRINRFIDWIIKMFGYGIILICMSILFPKSFYINNEYFGLWGFIGAIIIYLLNKTIKPVIVLLTLPITGLTMGIFYPFINVFILYIVSFILDTKFVIHGVFFPFLIAILISIINIIYEEIIVNSILERSK